MKSAWRTNAEQERTAKPPLTIALTRNRNAVLAPKPTPQKHSADAAKRTVTTLMPSPQRCRLPALRPVQKEIVTPLSGSSKPPRRNPTVIAQTQPHPTHSFNKQQARKRMPKETATL